MNRGANRPFRVLRVRSSGQGRDFDLLVIVRRPADRNKRYELVDKAIGEHLWPLDILVRSPAEIDERLRIGDSFFRGILSQGKVLYRVLTSP